MATILIVDDRPSNRQFLTTLLGYGGHKLLEAGNGVEALAFLRSEHPDLVITDILMPTMDGYEFVQQVRADSALALTPVIFYTATYSAPQAEALAKSCGVGTVLSKPCEPQLILAAVNHELGIREAGAVEAPADAGSGAVARRHPADDSMTLYLRELQEVQNKFEDLAKHGNGRRAERDGIKKLSQMFADNVAAMQRLTSRFSALLEVGMETMAERDPARLVELFFAAACEIIDSSYAAIGMLDENEQSVRQVFAKGFEARILRGDGARGGVLGKLLSGHRVLRMRSADGVPTADGLPAGHPATHDLLGIPVASADRVYGWMYFADRRGQEGFSEEDTRLATVMATKLALLYENAMLYDAIQKHAAQLMIEVSERRKTQKALQESEAGLYRAQILAKLAHVVTGPDGAFESWSETLPRIATDASGLMPKSTREWLELVHPEDRERFRSTSIQAAVKCARGEVEYRLRHPAGTWLHIRQVMEPVDGLGGADGGIRWFNTLQDVTEQKRSAGALQASEERFRAMFENAAVGIAHTDLDGRFVTANPKLCEIIGCPAGEVESLTFQDLTHPDDVRQSVENRARMMAGTAAPYERETRVVRRDGSQIWAHITTSLVRAADGTPLHFISVLHDISERKRMEQAVAEAEHKFRSIFESTVEGIFWTSRDGHVMTCNDAAARILGYDSPEDLVAHLTDVGRQVYVDPEGRRKFYEAMESKGYVRGFETRFRRKDGSEIWVSMGARKMPGKDGEWSALGLIQDVTDSKRAEQVLALEHAVARQLADADSATEGLQGVMRLVCESEGWDFGRYWRVDETAGVLRFADAWSVPGATSADVMGASRDVVFGPGVGLAGTVWQSGEPLWVPDVGKDARVLNLGLARAAGLRGAFVFPVLAKGKTLGVLAFSSREIRQPDERLLMAVRVIGGQVGQFLQRKLGAEALAASEERFRSLSMLSSDWFWEQDAEHRFVKFSGGDGVKGWGPDQSKAIGLHRWDLGGVVPITCSWEEHKGLLDAHKPFRSFEYQRILADGRLQYVESRGEPIFDAAGRFTGYRGVATEITQRKEAENRIKRLNRVYAVLSGINALIVRVRDREELFDEACRLAVETGRFKLAWIGMVDRDAGLVKAVAWRGAGDGYIKSMPLQIPGATFTGRGLAGLAVKERKAMIVDDMATDARITLRKESLERGFHSLVILPLVVADEAVGVLALYASEIGFFDQEEMRLLEELAGDIAFAIDHIDKASKIDYLAYYDVLTGLANRTHFHERLTQFVEAARRGAHRLAVIVLDIDRFKSINDSLGRDAGDDLLRQVAQRMRGVAADPDSLARIGADRFVVVRPSVVSEEEVARHNAQKLEKCFGTPYRVAGSELRISARAGIAIFPADGSDADALFTNAEAALKKAKATGERTLFYTQEMTERVAEKLALENKLRQALEKEEFVLHYQPKVDLETRGIVGVEALIRWQSPELGLVPPLKFIPLLEETGLILEVGAWALRRAARDHRGWVEQGLKAPRVAVNVSPIQLRQRDFVSLVESAILDGVAPVGIDLEITESLIMEDIQGNIGKLNAVRALGLEIAIDDFGTGYSSLAYLARLPVKTLKIDRSFVITMLNDPNGTLLVQTMISLAHSLRLKVVAEGVETEDQAKMLRLLRCDEMQGYLFSKPLPLEGVTALLPERGTRT